MKNDYLTIFFAGIVSAILYLSMATGTALASILVYLAPLPIVIVSLGWGRAQGVFASLIGAAVLLIVAPSTIILSLTYLSTSVLPFVFLAHLVHTHNRIPDYLGEKSSESEKQNHTDGEHANWYPIPALIVWAGVLSAMLTVIFVSLLGTNIEAYTQSINKLLEQQFFVQMRKIPEFKLSEQEIERVKTLTADYLPSITTGLYFIFIIINFWLGALIVKKSERLQRPWPELSTMNYPPQFAILLGGLMVLVLVVPGIYGLHITAFLSAVLCAYALLGLMILNTMISKAGFLKFIVYFSIFLVSLRFFREVVIILAILGVGEPVFRLRERSQNS